MNWEEVKQYAFVILRGFAGTHLRCLLHQQVQSGLLVPEHMDGCPHFEGEKHQVLRVGG